VTFIAYYRPGRQDSGLEIFGQGHVGKTEAKGYHQWDGRNVDSAILRVVVQGVVNSSSDIVIAKILSLE